MQYHCKYFRLVASFYDKQTDTSDSEVAEKLQRLVNSNKQVLKVQLAFVEVVMQELYKNIHVALSMSTVHACFAFRPCKQRVGESWTQ